MNQIPESPKDYIVATYTAAELLHAEAQAKRQGILTGITVGILFAVTCGVLLFLAGVSL
jgi:site-specific recombinase